MHSLRPVPSTITSYSSSMASSQRQKRNWRRRKRNVKSEAFLLLAKRGNKSLARRAWSFG